MALGWDKTAETAIREVPWFVRKRARLAVERRVEVEGRTMVTDADVAAVREETMARLFGRSPSSIEPALALVPLESGQGPVAVSAGSLEAFVARAEQGAAASALLLPETEIKVCGGAAGCPLSLADVLEARDRVAHALAESGAAAVVRSKAQGPLLAHHRFRVSISGCPNACSQPQIADVGLIANEAPLLDLEACVACGACVESCAERALRLQERLELVPERCVGCGACIRSCSVGALAPEARGWRVLMGGRLGRHPSLGREVADCASLDEAVDLIGGLVALWEHEGRPGERVGHLLDRLVAEGSSLTGLLGCGPQAVRR
jgi:anaerobic sulfite reductase subunit C